jgi:hypothetical protein
LLGVLIASAIHPGKLTPFLEGVRVNQRKLPFQVIEFVAPAATGVTLPKPKAVTWENGKGRLTIFVEWTPRPFLRTVPVATPRHKLRQWQPRLQFFRISLAIDGRSGMFAVFGGFDARLPARVFVC